MVSLQRRYAVPRQVDFVDGEASPHSPANPHGFAFMVLAGAPIPSFLIQDAFGDGIGTLPVRTGDHLLAEQEANLALFLSSPTMLKALQQVSSWLGGKVDVPGHIKSAVKGALHDATHLPAEYRRSLRNAG